MRGLRRLGYACLCLSEPDTSPRGTLLRNASPERLRALTRENLARLERVLRFSAAHAIGLFRVSSDVIPIGSHPVNDVPWWEELASELRALGDLVLSTDMRLSMHPGQYTVLSARHPRVLAAAVADLAYQRASSTRSVSGVGKGPILRRSRGPGTRAAPVRTP